MLKIHLGVCGIGYGHADRILTISKKLYEKGCTLIISSYGEGLEYLRKHGLRVYKVPAVDYGVLHEGKVSIKMTIFKNILLPIQVLKQIAYEVSIIDNGEVDLVVSDSRASTVIAAKILGKPTVTILNQFNIKIHYPKYRWIIESLESSSYIVSRIWLKSDKIVVADYPPPLTISKKNLQFPENIPKDKVEYVGPIIDTSHISDISVKTLSEKYGVGLNGKPVVLFMATGPFYERKKFIEKIYPMLKELVNEFEAVLTLGGLKLDSVDTSNLKIFEWVEDPLELIKISDIVVTRGGQTTLAKVLALGKPLVMIPIPAHAEQIGNAESIQDNGAGLVLYEEELSKTSLKKCLERILEDKTFSQRARDYSKVFNSLNPTEHVIKIIETMLTKS
ncbi:MAG: glycosyltransferase [Nitrososphaerota archaeon]